MISQRAILYIHGYGSTGNATKGQLLRKMMPQCRVVSPTFDYDHCSPWQIQQQICQHLVQDGVKMIVGSSFGGYHALCATAAFHGPVWLINPVREVVPTIRRVIGNSDSTTAEIDRFLAVYADFDTKVFQRQVSLNVSGLWPGDTPLHFALSTDDELLGGHRPLLDLFPHHAEAVWKENSKHHFLRFEELRPNLIQSLSALVNE